VDHLVLNEARPRSLLSGRPGRREGPATCMRPPPSPSPIKRLFRCGICEHETYVSMNIQYSRGCPFSCDFCDITPFLAGSEDEVRRSGAERTGSFIHWAGGAVCSLWMTTS
jgi:hypothetical protein